MLFTSFFLHFLFPHFLFLHFNLCVSVCLLLCVCVCVRVLQEYDDLLQTCRDRLAASGVPLHDFPFKSSKWILGGRTRVQDSADPHDGHQ